MNHDSSGFLGPRLVILVAGHDCALRTFPLGVLGAMQATLAPGPGRQLAFGQAKRRT